MCRLVVVSRRRCVWHPPVVCPIGAGCYVNHNVILALGNLLGRSVLYTRGGCEDVSWQWSMWTHLVRQVFMTSGLLLVFHVLRWRFPGYRAELLFTFKGEHGSYFSPQGIIQGSYIHQLTRPTNPLPTRTSLSGWQRLLSHRRCAWILVGGSHTAIVVSVPSLFCGRLVLVPVVVESCPRMVIGRNWRAAVVVSDCLNKRDWIVCLKPQCSC